MTPPSKAGDALDRFIAADTARIGTQLRAAAVLLKYEIQQQLSTPGRGRLYKVRAGAGYVGKKAKYLGPGRKGAVGSRIVASKFHRASLRGDSPAADTGTLKRSAYVEKSGVLQYTVGVATAYARALETKMDRPFMRPAFTRWLSKVGGAFRVSSSFTGGA